METIKLEDLNDLVIEEIARQCPQLKLIMNVDIEDVREYGYEFPMGDDEVEIVVIKGREYSVKLSPLKKYEKLIALDECKNLSPTRKILDEIYNCYCKIIENKNLFDEAMKRDEFYYTYKEHQNGCKIFVLMDMKNSIVTSILFYLYH